MKCGSSHRRRQAIALTTTSIVIVLRASLAEERLIVLLTTRSRGGRQIMKKRSTYKGSRSEMSQAKTSGKRSQRSRKEIGDCPPRLRRAGRGRLEVRWGLV